MKSDQLLSRTTDVVGCVTCQAQVSSRESQLQTAVMQLVAQTITHQSVWIDHHLSMPKAEVSRPTLNTVIFITPAIDATCQEFYNVHLALHCCRYEVLYLQVGLSKILEHIQLGLLDPKKVITMKVS